MRSMLGDKSFRKDNAVDLLEKYTMSTMQTNHRHPQDAELPSDSTARHLRAGISLPFRHLAQRNKGDGQDLSTTSISDDADDELGAWAAATSSSSSSFSSLQEEDEQVEQANASVSTAPTPVSQSTTAMPTAAPQSGLPTSYSPTFYSSVEPTVAPTGPPITAPTPNPSAPPSVHPSGAPSMTTTEQPSSSHPTPTPSAFVLTRSPLCTARDNNNTQTTSAFSRHLPQRWRTISQGAVWGLAGLLLVVLLVQWRRRRPNGDSSTTNRRSGSGSSSDSAPGSAMGVEMRERGRPPLGRGRRGRRRGGARASAPYCPLVEADPRPVLCTAESASIDEGHGYTSKQQRLGRTQGLGKAIGHDQQCNEDKSSDSYRSSFDSDGNEVGQHYTVCGPHHGGESESEKGPWWGGEELTLRDFDETDTLAYDLHRAPQHHAIGRFPLNTS